MDEDPPHEAPLTRREFAARLLRTAGVLAVPAAARALSSPLAAAPVTLLSNVMVPMRDGVQLATDIYLPAAGAQGGRWPVILERTPYDKTADSRSERTPWVEKPKSARAGVAAFFGTQGYVVISQHCRGRYRSQGAYVKYLSDGQDGYDTCAWIIR